MVSDDLHPEQIRAIQAMSLDRRLAVGMDLIRSARRMRRAALHEQHPDWRDKDLDDALRRWTLHGGV